MRKYLFALLVAVLATISAPAFGAITDANVAPNADIQSFKLGFSFASSAAYVTARAAAYAAAGLADPGLAEGDVFYDTTSDVWSVYSGSAWVSGGGTTLDAAYTGGQTIGRDLGTIAITDAVADATDTMSITRTAGTGDLLYLTNSAGVPGYDILGDAWSVDNTGVIAAVDANLSGNLSCVDASTSGLVAMSYATADALDVVTLSRADGTGGLINMSNASLTPGSDIVADNWSVDNDGNLIAVGGAFSGNISSVDAALAGLVTMPYSVADANDTLTIARTAGTGGLINLSNSAGVPGSDIVSDNWSVTNAGVISAVDCDLSGDYSGVNVDLTGDVLIDSDQEIQFGTTNLYRLGYNTAVTGLFLQNTSGADNTFRVGSSTANFRISTEFGTLGTSAITVKPWGAAGNQIEYDTQLPSEYMTVTAGEMTVGDGTTVEGRLAGATFGGWVFTGNDANDDVVEFIWQPGKWVAAAEDVSAQIVYSTGDTSCVLSLELCYALITPGTSLNTEAMTCVELDENVTATANLVTLATAATIPSAVITNATRKSLVIQIVRDDNDTQETCTGDNAIHSLEMSVTRQYAD